MLKTRIIPCLDVKDGRVVKGINFLNLTDAGDPVQAAQAYDKAGADELCFLDIAATLEGRETIYDLTCRTAERCFMPLTVGGGVRTTIDVLNLLQSGADKVSFNSAAVANPQIISDAANRFGSQCIVVAIDAKTTPSAQTPMAGSEKEGNGCCIFIFSTSYLRHLSTLLWILGMAFWNKYIATRQLSPSN